MIPIGELIDRYPLKLLPLAGDFFALVWYTHNNGHHAVLGASEAAVLSAYIELRSSHKHGGGGEPKAWWTLRIVAPPRAYVERVAKTLYEREINSFQYWLFSVIDETLVPYAEAESFEKAREERREARRTLPFLRPCPFVDPPWFATWLVDTREDEPEKVEEVEREQADYRTTHQSCVGGCHEGLLPAAETWADFYEVHKGVWKEELRAERESVGRRVGVSPRPEERRRFRDDLPEADPDRQLFAARADFGHHSKGLVFEAVSADHEFQIGNELFFFQGECHKVPAAVLEMVRAECERDRQAEAAAEIQKEATRQAELAHTRAVFARLFPELRKTGSRP